MTNKIEYIAIDKLVPHPDNPRKDVGDVTELADSIRKQGVLQNLTVVPVMDEDRYTDEYRVVIGHRRLAAAQLIELDKLPCAVVEMDYKTQLATMLSENMQRSDLTLLEQVEGIQMMLNLGESVEAVSDATGLSESTVRRRAKLAELPREEFRAASARGGRLEDYARLGELTDPENRKKALEAVGTPEFARKIDDLLRDERWKARKAKIIGILDGYATRVDERPKGWDYECGYDYWSTDMPSNTPPDPDRKYIYTVERLRVYVYVESQTATTSEDAAEAEYEAKIKQRRAALDELTKQAYERRRDFVLGMSPAAAAKHTDRLIRACADAVLRKQLAFAFPSMKNYLEIVDLDELTDSAISVAVEREEPSRLLLLTWYALSGDRDGEEYRAYWGKLEYKGNAILDRVYDTLIAMGYEPTADEQALRDGTHELFGEIE